MVNTVSFSPVYYPINDEFRTALYKKQVSCYNLAYSVMKTDTISWLPMFVVPLSELFLLNSIILRVYTLLFCYLCFLKSPKKSIVDKTT